MQKLRVIPCDCGGIVQLLSPVTGYPVAGLEFSADELRAAIDELQAAAGVVGPDAKLESLEYPKHRFVPQRRPAKKGPEGLFR